MELRAPCLTESSIRLATPPPEDLTPPRSPSFAQEADRPARNEEYVTIERESRRLQNLTRRRPVAARLIPARSFWERGAGLLALPALRSGEALWLEPCGSIHTWGMRYAIDVVFLSREHRVLAVWRHVGPWRIAWAPRGTHVAVEWLSGGASGVERGDLLCCEPAV